MTSSASDRPSVLLCEWDRDLRLAAGALLSGAGYSVSLAADGREAVSRTIAHPTACIVLCMPIAGGESSEVARSLRGLAPSTKIVAVAPDGFPTEADEVIPPTFAPADLIAAVKRAMGAPERPPEA